MKSLLRPSSFSSSIARLAGVVFCSAATLATDAGAGTVSDNFDGASLDPAKWTFGSTFVQGSATISGGALSINTGTNAGSQRAVIASVDNSVVNPFTTPITVTLSDISLTSASTVGSSFGWVVLGRHETDDGTPRTAAQTHVYLGTSNTEYNDGGGAIALTLTRNNSTGAYSVLVGDFDDTNFTNTYTLSGAPTGITWMIDDTTNTFNYSFTLGGGVTITGVTGGGNASGIGTATGSASWDVSFARFTEDDLGPNDVMRVALGAINAGALDTGTSSNFSVGAVSVVPEPSTFAMFLGGLGMLLSFQGRRLRQ